MRETQQKCVVNNVQVAAAAQLLCCCCSSNAQLLSFCVSCCARLSSGGITVAEVAACVVGCMPAPTLFLCAACLYVQLNVLPLHASAVASGSSCT